MLLLSVLATAAAHPCYSVAEAPLLCTAAPLPALAQDPTHSRYPGISAELT